MSDVDCAPAPVTFTNDGDHDLFSHVVRKSDTMKAYVLGQPITALCGKTWTPSRDASRFPVCPRCKELLAGRPIPPST